MFDFPASPSVGQTYTLGGVTYQWNGYAWMQTNQPLPAGVQYPAHGGCILEMVDAANARLRPCGGNRLIINGESRALVAPITIPKALLEGGAKPHLYTKWDGAQIVVEASATHHATHNDGVEVMTGDPSRTYVGMVYLYAGTDVKDDANNRLVASWFNRKNKIVQAAANAAPVSSTTGAAIGAVSYFISFAGDQVTVRVVGQIMVNIANLIALTHPRLDGTGGIENGGTGYANGVYVSAGGYGGSVFGTTTVHTLQLGGRVAGAAGTATVSATAEMELLI